MSFLKLGELNLKMRGGGKEMIMKWLTSLVVIVALMFVSIPAFAFPLLTPYRINIFEQYDYEVIWRNGNIVGPGEVLAVGDIDFQQKCYDTFDSFRKKNRTILFVSHDLDAIEKICDRVILLEGGRIKKQGCCCDVLAAYRATSPLARQSESKRKR